jgi:quercetin dioxygenase-like cupin family protein
MKSTRLIAASAVALLIAWDTAVAQQAKPTENKGLKSDVLTTIDLGKQGLNDYNSRQLRMRKTNLAPGGVVAYHSHSSRPAMDYVLKGAVIDHRDGAPDRTYKAGDTFSENTDVNHWLENKGKVPAEWITVDLFKE